LLSARMCAYRTTADGPSERSDSFQHVGNPDNERTMGVCGE